MQWPRWSELVLALVALAAVGLAGFGLGGAQKSGAKGGSLQVTATGTAQVTPNLAQINLGGQVQAPTAQGAMGKLNAITNAVVAALEKDGVAAQDIQTSNMYLNQNYDQQGRPNGYQANEQFTVTVRKLASTGELISAGLTAGANQFNNVTFTEADPNAGRELAVQKAIKAAKKQAASEAAQLGVALGRVTSVRVQGAQTPGPIFEAAKSAAGAAAPNVQPGSQSVQVQVQVTYSYQ